MSTVLASEESSSYPDESGLELGLSLGGGCGGGGRNKLGFGPEPEWGRYVRILTAKDFSNSSSSSSSSSSSYLTKAADNNHNVTASPTPPVSPPANQGVSNQVVGWPPIRAYRMNSMVSQVKYSSADEFQSTVEKCKIKNDHMDMNTTVTVKATEKKKKFDYVKVNMDGNGIGRKVDLSAHSCYETLARTMEDMFLREAASKRSSLNEHGVTGSLKLFNGSSEFVLTYEDKDGDWMLVGDVPWGMFINSVKRLRIMRTAEATGLGSRFQVRNARQSTPSI